MTITNPAAFTRDDWTWIKSTFTVALGQDFQTYKEMIAYSARSEKFGSLGEPGLSPEIQQILTESGGDSAPLPVYFSRRKCRDTSLGGNNAINPYPQYNETDDIMYPFTSTDFGMSGMGRVYSETIDDNQQLLYLTFGVPVLNTVSSFYRDSVVPELAAIMNKGDNGSAADIGYLLGSTVSTFIMLPVIPLLYLNKLLGGLSRTRITKYYDFASKMPLYYRLVNSILNHLAVNMGLANDGLLYRQDGAGSPTTGARVNDLSWTELAATVADVSGGDGAGLPEHIRKNGWDIFRIMLKKYQYETGRSPQELGGSTDQALQEAMGNSRLTSSEDGARTWTDQLFSSFTASLYDAQMFVGFRVEKSVDSTESFSSQTGMSEVAQAINSKIRAAQNISFTAMQGNLSDGAVGQAVKGVMDGLGGFVKGASDVVGLNGLTSIMTGTGVIDIPEVWQGSSASKNYSFQLELRAPYGDPLSIMQSIYVPLALILAGALPRAIGPTAYTSPFLCRAYCKGMFAVPLGMIDSLTIRRGGEQHGWNAQRLPTAVSVSFTIKDLSPTMYAALGDQSLWHQVFGENSSFQEYLLTLSGMGLAERILLYKNIKRKAQILINTVFATRLNPNFWGMEAGNSYPGRILSAILPTTKVPTN